MSHAATHQSDNSASVACRHLANREGRSFCTLAETMAGTGRAVPVSQRQCDECWKCPDRTNAVTIGMTLIHVRRENPDLYEEAKLKWLPILNQQSGSAMAKVSRYAASTLEWFRAGRPVRSDSEVARILRLCQSNECGDYEARGDDRGMCRACGCMLNLYGGLFNKIRRATEHCPKEYW